MGIQYQLSGAIPPPNLVSRTVSSLTKDEEASLCREIQVEMGSHFVPHFVYLDAIPRSPVGKFETFRCEIV